MVCLQLATVALLCLSSVGSGEKVPLQFSYITTRTGSFVAEGAIPVVDLALEQINNRSDILPNYTLSYTRILDSKVYMHPVFPL
jgi:gamma-aminobutyric acid type B receptor